MHIAATTTAEGIGIQEFNYSAESQDEARHEESHQYNKDLQLT